MPKFLPARSPPSKQDFPQPVTILYCAMCHPVCVKEWNGDGTWRSFRSDVAGQFLRKMPLPPLSSFGFIYPSFFCRLLSAVWALGPIIIRQSPAAAVVKHFAFSGRRVVGHYPVFKGKRALRRRSASLLPMQCTLSSYLYGSNFGAWLEFQCPIWVL